MTNTETTPSRASQDGDNTCAGSRLADEAQRLLRSIGTAGHDDLEAARQRLLFQMQDFSTRLEQLQDDTTHAARGIARDTRKTVRDHPLRAIGIAAAAGVLIGLIASRSAW